MTDVSPLSIGDPPTNIPQPGPVARAADGPAERGDRRRRPAPDRQNEVRPRFPVPGRSRSLVSGPAAL